MTRFFLECTVRAALIIAATAVVLYTMRVRVASVKHRVWTAVLLLMLALPCWTAWGPKLPFRLLPVAATRFVSGPVPAPALPASDVSGQATAPAQIAPPSRSLFTTGEEILLGIYLLGFLTLLTRLIIGTRKARWFIRAASPCDDAGSGGRSSAIALTILSNSACAAPVTIGCWRAKVILPAHWPKWSRQQLEVVLAHEGEHVRRRDPLVQWLALFNRAVFWFHPAAWWLERELSALAEESCDAAVIAAGHDPHDYAKILMNFARDVMDSGSRINSVAVAMPGVALAQRVRGIMEAAPTARISRGRATCVVISCAAFSALFLTVSLTHAQNSPETQADWEKAAGGKMSFEVASIKQDETAPRATNFGSNFPLDAGDSFSPTGGLLSASNQWFVQYIIFAYKLTQYQYRSIQEQLPSWANNNRYDIEARAAGNPTKDQYRLMMQSLLADRFKLTAHFQTKQAPAFAVVIDRPGKLGPQLRLHNADAPCGVDDSASAKTLPGGFPLRCGIFLPMKASTEGRVRFGASDASMVFVADWLMRGTGADMPVVDKTGLGHVDFVIEYSPDAPANPKFTPDLNGPTFRQALKDQLGLKLVSTTAAVDSFVIDHIEEPTPN